MNNVESQNQIADVMELDEILYIRFCTEIMQSMPNSSPHVD